MDNDTVLQIKNFFCEVGIILDDLYLLDGKIIPRETLLSNNIYKNVLKYIPDLKNIFSSSYMTCLHSEAYEKQKWPLLNLVRQVLKSCNYNLLPKRISNGYTKDGKKIYRRVFIIKRNVTIKE